MGVIKCDNIIGVNDLVDPLDVICECINDRMGDYFHIEFGRRGSGRLQVEVAFH